MMIWTHMMRRVLSILVLLPLDVFLYPLTIVFSALPRISVDLYMRASHLLEVKQTTKHSAKAGTKAA